MAAHLWADQFRLLRPGGGLETGPQFKGPAGTGGPAFKAPITRASGSTVSSGPPWRSSGMRPTRCCFGAPIRFTPLPGTWCAMPSCQGPVHRKGIEEREVAAVAIYQTGWPGSAPCLPEINPGEELDLAEGAAAILAGETPPAPVVRGTRRLPNFWPTPPAGSSLRPGRRVMGRPRNCLTGWPAWWRAES